MSKVRHTPEPWSASVEEDSTIYGESGASQVAAVLGSRNDERIDRANTRRIVACVNACAGIADPSVVPEMLGLLEELVDQPGQLHADTTRMRRIIAKAEGRE